MTVRNEPDPLATPLNKGRVAKKQMAPKMDVVAAGLRSTEKHSSRAQEESVSASDDQGEELKL